MDTAYAKASIAKGSKSFAAASRLLPAAVRDDVVRLYAWCRAADDLIDGQELGHGESVVHDADARLAFLREMTDAALAGRATGDPVFNRIWTLLRVPCVHLPIALGPRGLPLGITVAGRLGGDRDTLRAADWIHAKF